MSIARHHVEWMSLIETSGPFLSMPVLMRAFPQGLDRLDSDSTSRLREAYADWLERGAKQPAVHHAWIRHILTELLEYTPEFLAEGQAIPPGIEAVMANFSETLRPDFILKHREAGKLPLLLIEHYAPDQDLEKPVAGKIWKASPGTRMMELLRATGVPLGLVTNGEQWMLVYAPRGETTGFASWYADLWMQGNYSGRNRLGPLMIVRPRCAKTDSCPPEGAKIFSFCTGLGKILLVISPCAGKRDCSRPPHQQR